ncbi:Elongation factor 1-beta 2 [Spatholobus suberectus]|nr:Elongation factor 1-beta 2 [Spatholobus suberectus]
MAVDLSNLYKKSGLKSLDEFLSGKTYISEINSQTRTSQCLLLSGRIQVTLFPMLTSGASLSLLTLLQGVKHAVLLEFYPWNRQTDSKKLEEAVRSVEMTGLWWGQSKLVPDYFGINNLKIVLITVHYLAPVRCVIRDCLRASSEHAQNCSLVARCDIDAWFNDVA